MVNVTDQYCISLATSKGGFSCHSGDLSRKCHLCHGSCKSHKRGTMPPSSRNETNRNIFDGAHIQMRDASDFFSHFCSSWVLPTKNHLFFEISTRLLPDSSLLTLGAVLMCTDVHTRDRLVDCRNSYTLWSFMLMNAIFYL